MDPSALTVQVTFLFFCDHYLLMSSDRPSKPALKHWVSVLVRVIQSQHWTQSPHWKQLVEQVIGLHTNTFFSSHVVMWDWTQDWRLYCQCCFVTICFWYLVMGHHCQHETLTSALVHVVQSQHWTPLVEQVKFEHEADCFKLAEPKRVPQSMCVWSII